MPILYLVLFKLFTKKKKKERDNIKLHSLLLALFSSTAILTVLMSKSVIKQKRASLTLI